MGEISAQGDEKRMEQGLAVGNVVQPQTEVLAFPLQILLQNMNKPNSAEQRTWAKDPLTHPPAEPDQNDPQILLCPEVNPL